jgi:uncharacterized membrane protein YagU involved in acid resistance
VFVKDTLTRGAIAGIIGAIIQNTYAFTSKAIGFTDRIYVDYAGVMIMYQYPKGTISFIVSLIAHLMVDIMLGVILAFILKYSTEKYYIVKGALFGGVVWFLLMGLAKLYRLPQFTKVPPQSALSLFVGAIVFGVTTGYVIKRFAISKHDNP